MAARPARDSLTRSISRRFWEPVRRYCPGRSRAPSMRSLMYGSRPGAYCASSKITGGG